MENISVRIKLTESGMKQWQLARLLGISESQLSRKLRTELPQEEQDRIIEIIQNRKEENVDV